MPRWTISNNIPDVAELAIDNYIVDASISGPVDLQFDLRFATRPIDIEGKEIEIGFKCAELYLILDGAEIVPGSRYGDHKVDPTAVIIQNESVRSHSESTRSGNLQIAGDGPSVELGAGRVKGTESTVSKETQTLEYRISAKPNGLWMLEGPGGEALAQTYFNGDILCKIRPLAGANRAGVKIYLITKKKNIWHKVLDKKSAIHNIFRGSVNIDKVFKAIVAKSLPSSEHIPEQGIIEIAVADNYAE